MSRAQHHILQIHNAGKMFRRNKLWAFKNINLTVSSGEFIAIVGPSGCGKTTLLNLMAGLENPTQGSVLYRGNPVFKPGPERVLVFQENALYPWRTVEENLSFGLEIAGMRKAERKAIVDYYLQMVNLENFRKSYIHELSGGMKQRLSLARALAIKSDILLMDEPFAALDTATRRCLQDDLLRIWQETGKTILFVTHSTEEAVYLADRVIQMTNSPGEIIQEFKISMERPRNLLQPELSRTIDEISQNFYEMNGNEHAQVSAKSIPDSPVLPGYPADMVSGI